MRIALIDNGSLEPAAHRNLRATAAALSARAGVPVTAVSWKHSDRIPPLLLDGEPASTLFTWLRSHVAAGERKFVFTPFFISAQGAIGSWLRRDIEKLRTEMQGAFRFEFTAGLAAQGALVRIVADRVLETITTRGLVQPAVIVVDHGGPSAASAALRNEVAEAVRATLGSKVRQLTPASLEGGDYAHNRPLFAEALAEPSLSRAAVVVAPLFLAPGRHAGADGDLAQIAAAATRANPALRLQFCELVGTHPYVVDVLADALNQTLSTFHAAA